MSPDKEHPVNAPLERLIDAWCDRRDLHSLAILLPPYSNAGLTDDWARVMEGLRSLRGRAGLPESEKAEVERLILVVEQIVYRR